MPKFQMAIGAGALFHKWSDVADDFTHSADLLETAMSGVVPSRTEGEGRPVSYCLDRCVVEMVLRFSRTDLVFFFFFG